MGQIGRFSEPGSVRGPPVDFHRWNRNIFSSPSRCACSLCFHSRPCTVSDPCPTWKERENCSGIEHLFAVRQSQQPLPPQGGTQHLKMKQNKMSVISWDLIPISNQIYLNTVGEFLHHRFRRKNKALYQILKHQREALLGVNDVVQSHDVGVFEVLQ